MLKHLTSSVSCALDEAAAALTRMRTDPEAAAATAAAASAAVDAPDGRSLVEACNDGDISKVRKRRGSLRGRVAIAAYQCRNFFS